MKYYICFYNDNYADEFDVEGFLLATDEELDKLKKQLQEAFEEMKQYRGAEFNYYCGSNQSIYYPSYESVLEAYTFNEISKEEYDVIKKTIGDTYGSIGPLGGY